MDIRKYSPEIQALRTEYESMVGRSDPGVTRVLARLRRQAIALGDDLLLGNTYHCYAFVEYFIRGRYDAFLKYLRHSARCLFRCGDQTEMAHVYYLIAIDALNKGMYDIACNDFLRARDLFSRAGEDNSAAILDLNIGHVLQQLNSYSKARFYMRRALKVIRKNRQHPHYTTNVASIYMNEGICCLGLHRPAQAEKAYLRTSRFLERNAGRFQPGTQFDLALLGTRLFLALGKQAELKECFSELLSLTASVPQVANYIEEIRRLSDELLAAGEHGLLGELLRTFQDGCIPENATNALRILVGIRVDYHMAIADSAGLRKAYREQRRIQQKLIEEQQHAYQHTRELIRLISELRGEQEAILSEHETLLYLVQNDSLTGIPNRGALNEYLDRAFERCYADAAALGVCLIDVDELKAYNDTFGHAEGDRRLAEFGDLLRRYAASSPAIFAARYGGDEFVLIFEKKTDAEIRTDLKELAAQSPLRISQGVYNRIPTERLRVWDYLSRADSAMYEAKRKARAKGGAGSIGFYRDGKEAGASSPL